MSQTKLVQYEVTVPNEPYEFQGEMVDSTISIFDTVEEARKFIDDLPSKDDVKLHQASILFAELEL